MFNKTWSESSGDSFSYQRLYNSIMAFEKVLPLAKKDAILKYYDEYVLFVSVDGLQLT
jgi:hypothetical protein